MTNRLVELLRGDEARSLDVSGWPKHIVECTVRNYWEVYDDPEEKAQAIEVVVYTVAAYLALC